MTRSTVAAIMAGLIAVHAHAAEQDLAAQIKALEKEQLATLTTLVEIYQSQYSVGTIDCGAVIMAEAGLVNSEVNAIEKPEERVALLTKDLIRQRATMKSLENLCFVNTDAEVEWWRSTALLTEVRLLSEQANAAAQVGALKRKRVEALTKLVAIATSEYRVGTIGCGNVIRAETDLVNAQLDTTEKPEERITLLTAESKKEAELLKIVDSRFQAGTVCQDDVYRARSLLLSITIKLLRERSRQKDVAVQTKELKKERVETLAKLVAFDEPEYKAGRIDCEDVADARTELIGAQLEATDQSEERIAMLAGEVKSEAEFLKIADARYQAGTVSQGDVYRARSLLLSTRVWLLRERSSQIQGRDKTESKAK